jgi:hypothetical protein
MALAAPWIAAYIHSAFVFHEGFRLYNAEIGGIYFHGNYLMTRQLSLSSILTWVGGCGLPATLTFLALLPCRSSLVFRWIVWAGFIALWTFACFQLEIAYH